jgi:hypothetical protein
MKNIILIFSSLFLFNSCINDELDFGTTNTNENYIILTGNLKTQTLSKDFRYLIKGQAFVRDGSVLTLEPGTVVFGDKASKGTLVVDLGGKIIAEGTAAEPIVFTSSQKSESRDRGDWGGIVILGKARVNQPKAVIEGISPAIIYGGADDNDNSGILKYVRVEYAGIELTPNNETNSITMGGVGKGTTMEYCQVSYGGDDGFEWFGGTVNGKYFISLGMWDDCYDIDYGWSGHLQFALSVRYPSFADQSGSNIIETDSAPSDTNPAGNFYTTGVVSNLTGIGPIYERDKDKSAYNSINANFQHCIDMRRYTSLTIANSVFVGMPRGLRFNQKSAYDRYVGGAPTGYLLNNIMSAPQTTYSISGSGYIVGDVTTLWNATNTMDTSTTVQDYYTTLGLNSNIFYGANTTNFYPLNPNFEVTSGLLTSGAAFTNAKLTNAYLTPTSYRGAFGTTDWTNGWAEFVPNLKQY